VLSGPVRRRQWDICDPQFSDAIPSLKDKDDFFEVYRTLFLLHTKRILDCGGQMSLIALMG